MEPNKLSQEACVAKAITFALPFYKSCFPFDEKVTAEAIRCLKQESAKVSDRPFDKHTCAIPTNSAGFHIELSYRDRVVDVSISKKGFAYSDAKHREEEQDFTQQAREFILKQLKDTLPAEQLGQVEIKYVSREAFDNLTLKKVFAFREMPKNAVSGWVLEVRTHEGIRKFRLFDTPNETCWKMKIERSGENQTKKRRLGGVSGTEHKAKLKAARLDSAKLCQVHHVTKENIVPAEVMKKAKEKVLNWFSCRYPLALKPEDIAFDKTVWRDDIPHTDFWDPISKFLTDVTTKGYESEFTCQGETFKVRFSLQGEKVRCEGLENHTRLPRSVIGDLKQDAMENPSCRVLSFTYKEGAEDYKLQYSINGTIRTLVGKY